MPILFHLYFEVFLVLIGNFLWLILLFLGSSLASDPPRSLKTITYGANSGPVQDISLLCGNLISTLERLELLSEVCV